MKIAFAFGIRLIQDFVLASFCIVCAALNLDASTHTLLGAGATFPQPYYNKIFDVYERQYGMKIRYRGTGSSDGISQLINKTIDFAGTDVLLNDKEKKDASIPVIHIPTCIGAVVITYNISGNPRLKLTPEVISQIFLGKITKWNDPKIASTNKHVTLPDASITVIHRSDGSGTTYIFSEYLTKTNPEWKEKVSTGKMLKWPTGQGARGNPGVAGLISQISGSIGYVELTYAIANSMTVASVQNMSGRFIEPTTLTAGMAANVPLSDFYLSITNTSVRDGYPISGFTWLAIYSDLHKGGLNREKAEELVKLIWWVIHDGQKYTEGLHYAPLPKPIIDGAEKIIKTITYNGIPIIKK
jgi:phosphate transport system substrate-binding protein